eukprot:768331-Hanusia_phi.AAC.2
MSAAVVSMSFFPSIKYAMQIANLSSKRHLKDVNTKNNLEHQTCIRAVTEVNDSLHLTAILPLYRSHVSLIGFVM